MAYEKKLDEPLKPEEKKRLDYLENRMEPYFAALKQKAADCSSRSPDIPLCQEELDEYRELAARHIATREQPEHRLRLIRGKK
jgi:hypothetical protein